MPFSLNEVDLHLHAGLERRQTLSQLLDIMIGDGRRVLGLLDHDFLYYRDKEEFEAWLKRKDLPRNYENGLGGLRNFYSDIAKEKEARKNLVTIFQGIEVFVGKLGSEGLDGLPDVILNGLDFLGLETWIKGDEEGCGRELLDWTLKLERYCEKHDIFGILCHPFRPTFERMAKAGKISDLNLRTNSIFPPKDVEYFVENAKLKRVYVEINYKFHAGLYNSNRRVFSMVANTVKMLKEGGMKFSIGSDYHRIPTPLNYNPEAICAEMQLKRDDFQMIDALLERG